MILDSFEYGTKVKVMNTSTGVIVDGTIVIYYTGSEKNIFAVEFIDTNKCYFRFSKRTGKIYNLDYPYKVIK